MDTKRSGKFTYHFIQDPDMRKVIERTMRVCNNSGKYSELINDKDILIVDDSISQGNTIKEACNLIQSTFVPKSIVTIR